MNICSCLTNKNTQCKSNGAHRRQHNDHIHNVCGAHLKQDEVKFIFCDEQDRVPNQENLAAVQQQMKLTNTDGLGHVAEIREEMQVPKKIYTCNEVGCTNFEKMTAEDHLHHMINEHPVRIMVTGHAELGDLKNQERIATTMKDLLEGYVNTYGPRVIVVSGGALGADRLWALAAYQLDIPFEVYVPRGYGEVFVLQEKNPTTKKWVVRENGRKMLDKWYKMLELASGVFDENGDPWPYLQGEHKFHRGANFRRNITMIKVSQIHVAVSAANPISVVKNTVWSGGTYHCIRQMKKLGVKNVMWIPRDAQIKVTHIIHLNEGA